MLSYILNLNVEFTRQMCHCLGQTGQKWLSFFMDFIFVYVAPYAFLK